MKIPSEFKGKTLTGNEVKIPFDKKSIAETIYSTQGIGLAGSSLALKMFSDNGDADYNEEEIGVFMGWASRTQSPLILDAIKIGLTPKEDTKG